MLTRLLLASVLIFGCTNHGVGAVGDQPDATNATRPDAPTIKPTRDASMLTGNLCSQTPPPNAPVPRPRAAPTAGSCPILAAGLNNITSSGNARSFLLVLPTDMTPDEELPVIFMWYWLGGSSTDFLNDGEVQQAVDQQRFIAVIPNSIGADVGGSLVTTTFNVRWPFDITAVARSHERGVQLLRRHAELRRAPVQRQPELRVDRGRQCRRAVHRSASRRRAARRCRRSSRCRAGVSATIIKPWVTTPRAIPGVVLWGGNGPPGMDGVKDILGCFGLGMDFSVASHALGDRARRTGLVLRRVHPDNCGHVEPPVDAPAGESKFAAIWDFAFNHPFWLPAGTSPYQTTGLPTSMPAWCGIGANGATPRSDLTCPPAENPCAY